MALAPNIEELERRQSSSVKTNVNKQQPVMEQPQMIKQSKPDDSLACQDFSADTLIPVHVFGLGGAGKTAALRFAQAKLNSTAKFTTIDTSGIVDPIPGIESFRIKDLNGSGKLRRDNVEEITNFINDYTARATFSDVNIVIMSCSGGSGSLLGPLLVDEILRQKKIVIVIGIIDTDSEVDTMNALNTLKTLDNFTTKRKGYVPTILFDNNHGRTVVDNGVDTMLANLTMILDVPYIGLDVQDRIKFLNPNVFDGINGGIKLLCISTRADGNWEEGLGIITPEDNYEKLDATLLVCHKDKNISLDKRCFVTFRGYYEDAGIAFAASIGYQIPDKFIKGLNATIHAHRSVVAKKQTKIVSEYEIGEQSENGLVL